MLTLALLLAATTTLAPGADGDAHRRVLLEAARRQLDANSAACHAAQQVPASPAAPATSCAAVLADYHRLRALDRAALPKAKPTRTVRCKRPRGLAPEDEPTALDRCLTSTFGRGALAPAVDADFTFVGVGRVITGTGVLLNDDDIAFTLLADETGVLMDVVHAASRQTGAPPTTALRITAMAPLGSDRVTTTVLEQLEVDTPVVGGHVVCRDRPQIMRLGRLVDVVMEAPGYHPEQDPKRAVYRYAVPCPGTFVGAGVGLKAGRYRPSRPRDVDSARFQPDACTGNTCHYVLPGKTPTTLDFVLGENGVATITPIGDINGDGVEDYSADDSNAGGGSNALYLSRGGSHVVVARLSWSS